MHIDFSKDIVIECCDNLALLGVQDSGSVDLIYSDILYGTGRNFGDYVDSFLCEERHVDSEELWRVYS